MPRGRHRTSLQTRRLLPSLTAVAVASACAGGSLASDDPVTLRVIVVVAAAAVYTGAVLQRRRERIQDREISRLQTARIRDEWHTDEKIAELESDLEDSREIRTRAERKLNAKRSEFARLRGEHAALLKRYATAESERARALEKSRLALGPAAPCSPLTPSAFLRASAALDALTYNAARQEALEAAEAAERARRRQRDETRKAARAAAARAAEAGAAAAETAEAAPAAAGTGPEERGGADDGEAGPAAAPRHTRTVTGPEALRPVRELRRGRVPAAAVAVVPPSAQRVRRSPVPEPGFDFFGTQRALTASPRPAALPSGEDLADVVGEEIAAAEAAARAAEAARAAAPVGAHGPVSARAGSGAGSVVAGDPALADPADAETISAGVPDIVASAAEAGSRLPGAGVPGAGAAGPPGEDRAPAAAPAPAAGTGPDGDGAVIDLTEHDETEAIDVRGLRAFS